MSVERWLPVVGYEGWYEVSDQGRVRSVDRTIIDSLGRTRRLRGVVLSAPANPYLNVGLRNEETRRTHRVHVLVLTAFVEPPPTGLIGCHENGDYTDARLVNLRWDTWSSNSYDTVRHGRNHLKARKVCLRGHRLALPNLTKQSVRNGRRTCWACTRAHSKVNSARRHGRTLDFQLESDRAYAEIMSGVAA